MPALPAKAAALLDSIVRNHALVDGNKRLGWVCQVVSLDVNGIWMEVDDDEAYDVVMALASGAWDFSDLVGIVSRWAESGAGVAQRSAAPPRCRVVPARRAAVRLHRWARRPQP